MKNSIVDKKLKLASKLNLSKNDLVSMLENIYLSRKLDDTEITMKKQSKAFFQISGAGHEGILTAAAKALRPGYDWFIPYYRDRALCLGLGVSPYEMLCQANGNIGDTASFGRQMPTHWGNSKLNILSKSSCTGTQFLQACGLAETGLYFNQISKKVSLPKNLKFKKDEIVYVSCGDGTTSQGEFWEAITTAVVNKLPVLFLVEDNGYAISVPVSTQTPKGSISETLNNFPDLKILVCDGNCPIESYESMLKAANYIRAGKGPCLIHASCTRPYSHSMSDDQVMYRSKEELIIEKKLDVFNSYGELMVSGKIINEEKRLELLKQVESIVKQALDKAIKTPWAPKEEALNYLYSDTDDIASDKFKTSPKADSSEDITMAASINRVLVSEFSKNPLLRMFGEDVADFPSEISNSRYKEGLPGKGGVFKITSGVQKKSLKGQVFNSPLAEANIIGRAVGAAARGVKPIVEIQFFDYIWTAFMQLKNEVATLRYRSGNDFKCPMVVRVPIGGYLRGGAIYHSQSGESIFTHIPGLRVAYPSNAMDAVGLLRTAIYSDDPVMFLEHKHLYYQGYNRGVYPGDNYMIPFGKARVIIEGEDATIITWGALVQKSIDAVKKLKEQNYSVEIIDLRTLAPFDIDAIVKSIKKTSKVLIVHEENKTSGFAGEIVARINEECFEYLDAPVLRVTSKDSHIPYCPDHEEFILPQVSDILEGMKKLLAY